MLEAAARDADIVVAAVSGAAGLKPTHAALRLGRHVALANKESLVCAGDAFMRDAKRYGATIWPMDSEHDALNQALAGRPLSDVRKMMITASGGPFRTWARERIAAASPTEAAAHPTWSMGMKINIDSASLMNKGLELIEAHHLFAIEPERLDVVVHPQSVIHGYGLLGRRRGSPRNWRSPTCGCRSPTASGSGDRLAIARGRPLDLVALGSLTFEAADADRFPCLAPRSCSPGRGRGGADGDERRQRGGRWRPSSRGRSRSTASATSSSAPARISRRLIGLRRPTWRRRSPSTRMPGPGARRRSR